MTPDDPYGPAPTRDEVESWAGPALLVFGVDWCPHCRAAEPHLAELMPQFPGVKLVKVEDGPGRPLGRSFRVKLWPNFVFLRDGKLVRQEARPDAEAVRAGLEAVTRGG